MAMMKQFLKRMLTVFLRWHKPDSKLAKPRCMIKTKAAEIRIQRLLSANLTYSALSSNLAYSVGSSAASNEPAPSKRRDAGSMDLMVMDCWVDIDLVKSFVAFGVPTMAGGWMKNNFKVGTGIAKNITRAS